MIRYRYEVTIEDRGFETPCLIWHGPLNIFGYPRVWLDGVRVLLHRHVCTLEHGPPPGPQYDAHHKCEERVCIEPTHLEWMGKVAHVKYHRPRQRRPKRTVYRRDSEGRLMKDWHKPQ